MFEKTENDFRLLSVSDWIFHHYMSGDVIKESSQIELALRILDSTSFLRSHEAWSIIDAAMGSIPWVVHPEKLSMEEFQEHPLDTWVEHFFTSGQEDIELEWKMIADLRMRSSGNGFDTWQKILEECNHAEEEWKRRLQAKRKWCCSEDRAHAPA